MSSQHQGECGHEYRLRVESGEEFVAELAAKTFLIDWCFPNPKLPSGKELCDLLVIFEGTAIIWQVKNTKLKSDGSIDLKAVDKNLRQLKGARRGIFKLRTPIEIANARRQPERLNPDVIDEVFLVSAMVGDCPDLLGAPIEIGGFPCHVLTRDSVEIILDELDTISDFLAYLREKERVLPSIGSILLEGGEKELLAHYILNERSLADLGNHSSVYIGEGAWEDLQNRPEYLAKQEADRISYGWDSMIDSVHLGVHPKYERIAREMAKLNRFDRRYMSQSFYDAHLSAHQSAAPRMTFKRVGSFKGTTFVFLFAGDAIAPFERKAALESLCFIARGMYLENKTVLGIQTEMEFRPECSYAWCFMEIDQWTEEHEVQRQQLQEETGFLTQLTESELTASEYPDL
jgi:hypothetical protein